MRICAAADLHYPRDGLAHARRIAHSMCGSGAGVLVLAGDVATGEAEHQRTVLGLFADFAGPKLYVPGNHDLWSDGRSGATERLYREELPAIVEGCGFRYLPAGPVVVGDTAFVGAAGWYDYSLRQQEPPRPGLRVTPLRPVTDGETIRLRAVRHRVGIAWEDVTGADCAAGGLAWTEAGEPRSLLWNDTVHIAWGAGDAEVCRREADQVTLWLAGIPATARRIVGVCHCVPFSALLGGFTREVPLAHCRAYMGSDLLGAAFAADSRVRMVLCGHAHHQKVCEVGNVVAANCSVGARRSGPLLLTLPDEEPS
jgi:predicted phosphodiesterase